MASKDGDLAVAHHFEDLMKHYNNEDFDKALKSANAILKETPSDPKALHCKAVCLVQLGKFADALDALKNVELKADTRLLKVYALYRLGRYADILKELPAGAELTLELKEVRAQALYKLEKYEECRELYKELLKKQRDDLDAERQSNLMAVLTQLQLLAPSATGNKFTPSAAETYELVFNSAALDLARGDLAEAEKKFRRAQVLFQEYAEEEQLSPAKIKAEMITIKTQLVGVLLRRQRQQPTQQPDTSKLPAAFNMDALEANFLNQSAKLKKKAKKEADALSPKSVPTGKAGAGDAAKKKAKKRKPRLPKNYDPNVKPDPERWLPKIERSNFKKKKDKRGNASINKGTQGSTAQAEVQAPPTPKSQHSGAAAANAGPAGPRQGKPQAATKKQAKKRPKK
ncbi:putative Signal recognition particle subunit SRP72 [Hypsibius exemplaris]|uniref:Signal recognition particle subunit SRP72 n=1 Tax=Hypsibius exemplaris TaxID=2072580 RepID=A0A1W0WR84_HYPEX|nr:putative Signal recognition particle subunit SRP72 [Hypsibius exemplaris]